MEIFTALLLIALFLGLAKLFVWGIKAGFFLILLPIKIFVGLLALGLTFGILFFIGLPFLFAFAIPIIPIVLLIIGIILLFR